MLSTVFAVFAVTATILPIIFSNLLTNFFHPTIQQYQLMKSFSLLLLGMFLSSLATLNFSLAFLVGLCAAPLTYLQPLPTHPILRIALAIVQNALAPTTLLVAGCRYWNLEVGELLREAAYGWDVWGMNTQVVVWCVWGPAWVVGAISLWGSPVDEGKEEVRGSTRTAKI